MEIEQEYIEGPEIELNFTKKQFYGCDCEYVDKYYNLLEKQNKKTFMDYILVYFTLYGIVSFIKILRKF